MFTNFRKKSWIISALVVLVILNFAAFYVLRKGIQIHDPLKHAKNEALRNSLQQKQIFRDIFPAAIITLDIACILFLFYLLLKLFFKSLKKSTSKK